MNDPVRAWSNGVACDHLSILDRGLHYGDGVFRSLRVEQGVPRDWERHCRRLLMDAARLKIRTPAAHELTERVTGICEANRESLLKIILTRGASDRGYQYAETGVHHEILLLYPAVMQPRADLEAGIQVRVCDTRLAINPSLAGIKHLNRLEQILARAEWHQPDIAEGLMLDTDGRLIEGVSSNVFLIHGRTLSTPDLSRCGVAGVTREMILEAASAYTNDVRVCDLRLDDLLAADAAFVCNSVKGIRPLRQLAGKHWEIDPMIRKLQQHLGDR